jgi:hypothetical protein
MEVSDAVSVFRDGTAKMGIHGITTTFFDLPAEAMLMTLKAGYHPFSNDLVILVSALMGLGSTKINKRITALRNFANGKSFSIEHGLFDGITIAAIRVASREQIFNNVGTPLVVISIDGGNTWSGMIKLRFRTAPIQTWVNLYYTGLAESIKYKPIAEFFLHDFRYVAVHKPQGARLEMTNLYLADSRTMDVIKHAFTALYNTVPHVIDMSHKIASRRPPIHLSSSISSIASSPLPWLPPQTRGITTTTSTSTSSLETRESIGNRSPSRRSSVGTTFKGPGSGSPRKSPKRGAPDPPDEEERDIKKARK